MTKCLVAHTVNEKPGLPGTICNTAVPVGAEIRKDLNSPMSHKAFLLRIPSKLEMSQQKKKY